MENKGESMKNISDKILYIIGYEYPMCFLSCFIFLILLMAIIISETFKN